MGQHPFLRPVVLLAAGIALGDAVPLSDSLFYVALLVLAAVLAVAIVALCLKSCGGVVWNMLFLACGYMLMSMWLVRSELPDDTIPQDIIMQARVTDGTEERPQTVRCTVTVGRAVSHDGTPVEALRGKTLLTYVSKDSASMAIRDGDVLMLSARLTPKSRLNESVDFDYARYLRRQGIATTAFVRSGHWSTLSRPEHPTLMQRIRTLRSDAIDTYRRLGIGGQNLSVLTAMTLGDRSELTDETMDMYSRAGINHVLAMSGLHVGIVYGLLLLIVAPLWSRRPQLKPFIVSVIVGLMWFLAVFTGLSPSIVRSVIMFTVLTVASFLTEKPLSMNSLAFTAFVMLLVRPAWLLHVGFQLSFAAVASILLFGNRIRSLLGESRGIRAWLKGSVAVSVAAQIGTAPILMYVFHQLPVHFLLSNLLVIPIVTALLYLAVFIFVCIPLPWLQQPLAWTADGLLTLQNAIVGGIERLPLAVIDGIDISLAEVFLLYLIIFLAVRAADWHTPQRVIRLLSAVLVLVALHLAQILV